MWPLPRARDLSRHRTRSGIRHGAGRLHPGSAWERAMRLQEVVLKAISGELHWFRAADIFGVSPRTMLFARLSCRSRAN